MVTATASDRKVRQRGKKVEVPPEQKEEILRLSKIGHSIAKISEMTPFSRWTVHQVIKEARGEVAVQRERQASRGAAVAEASAETPQEAPTREVVTRPPAERPVRRPREIPQAVPGLTSASEIAAKTSAAVDEARSMMRQMEEFTKGLEDLWERAEKVSQMEESLTQALTTFQVLKQRLDDYKFKLEEVESKNVERAMAVHSQSSLLRGN